MPAGYEPRVKSVGHGVTCVRDLEDDYEVWLVLYELAQDLGHRMREYGIEARGVQVTVRDRDLDWQQWQIPLPYPTRSPLEISQTGFELFRARYGWEKPVRALTIRGINPVNDNMPVQTDLFSDYLRREKRREADDCIDGIRNRYGYCAIGPAALREIPPVATDKCETVPMPPPMYR
jgi:DNA polymerase-4